MARRTQKQITPFSQRKRKRTASFGLSKQKKIVTVRPFTPGREKELPSGGGYRHVRAFNELAEKFFKSTREADHTPPKSTYKGTDFEVISVSEMPAVSLDRRVHRYYVSTIGSSDEAKIFRAGTTNLKSKNPPAIKYDEEAIKTYMEAGNFKKAMLQSFSDQKNAAPHSTYYAVSQTLAAEYAYSLPPIKRKDGTTRGLLTYDELHEVLAFVWHKTYAPPTHATTGQSELPDVTDKELKQPVEKLVSSYKNSGRQQNTRKAIDPLVSDPLAGTLPSNLTSSAAAEMEKSQSVNIFSSSPSSSSKFSSSAAGIGPPSSRPAKKLGFNVSALDDDPISSGSEKRQSATSAASKLAKRKFSASPFPDSSASVLKRKGQQRKMPDSRTLDIAPLANRS